MNKHSNIAAAGLCAGLFVFSSLTASAEWTLSYDGTRWQLKDGTWTLNVERDDDARTLTITKYVGGTGALDLTAVEHDTQGYKVVAIADATRARDSSFWGLNGITSLCAPDLVKIGDNAFRGCSTLKTIDADTLANVETIGVEAFHVDSGGLEGDLVLPRVTALPDLCFQSCKNITSISAPRVVSVGYRALYYCEALENVVICGGGAIGNDSFRGIKEGAGVPQRDGRTQAEGHHRPCSHTRRSRTPLHRRSRRTLPLPWQLGGPIRRPHRRRPRPFRLSGQADDGARQERHRHGHGLARQRRLLVADDIHGAVAGRGEGRKSGGAVATSAAIPSKPSAFSA